MKAGHSVSSQQSNDNKPPSQPVFDDRATKVILENLQAGIVIIDEETHVIVEVNRKAEEMIGCDRKNIIGGFVEKLRPASCSLMQPAV